MRRVLPMVVLTVALVGGCASVTSGHPSALSKPASTSASAGASDSPASTLPAIPAFSRSAQQALLHRLLPLPQGAVPRSTVWADLVTPSIDQFVDNVYAADNRAVAAQHLVIEGVTAIAHRLFVASNGDIADVIVLSFRSDASANSRFFDLSYESVPGTVNFTLPGFTSDNEAGYRATAVDQYGFVRVHVFAHKLGSGVLIDTFFYSKSSFHDGDLASWMTQQYHLS